MNLDVSKIEKSLSKTKKKDNSFFKIVKKKIIQIGSCDEISIQHFKNLRHDSSEYKRVHIGSYVLIFKIKKNTVIFEKFDHHDTVYKK